MTYPLVHNGQEIGRASSAANVVRVGRFLRTEYLGPDDYVTIGDFEGELRPADIDAERRQLEDDPESDDASHLTAYEVGLPATY